MRGSGKLIVAGLLIVAAVAYLIVTSTDNAARFFLTIEEVRALGENADRQRLTVSGAVLGETIRYDSSQPRVTFTIVQVPGDPREVERAGGLATVLRDAVNDPDAPRMDVVYDDVRPDLLQHQSQAIVRGKLGKDGRFYADEVLLKCPSRYEDGLPGQAAEGS